MEYAELHCHSAFSLLDGASNPEELAARAAGLGLAALALTDHDDLGGAVRFAQAAKETSLAAIVGAELTLEDDSHLTLLVEDQTGYKNLCYLITLARSNCERGSPRVPYDALFAYTKGLIVLSGCPHGAIPESLARGDSDMAEEYLCRMLEAFAGAFYLEAWDHHIAQEAMIARQLLELSKKCTVPWVVTNNVHYATPRKRIVHDVLTCLRHEVTLATAGRRLRPNGSWYLKSPQEMAHTWRHNLEGLKNTLVVAERCQFRLESLKPSLPYFSLPPPEATSCSLSSKPAVHDDLCLLEKSREDDDRDMAFKRPPDAQHLVHSGLPDTQQITHNGYLEKLVWEGVARRYPELTEKHFRQINHELSLITKLGLAPYFLIMWDIVRFAQSQSIAIQGRGSAANSAVCYCLGITAVDPVGMELLFERFLSEGRNEPPDIDLDIAHQEREKVLQYVYEKYGRSHAAMVCEAITYRGRSAVRDAARVLGFSPEQADRLAAQAQFSEAIEAAKALAGGGAAAAGCDSADKRVQLLIEVVAGLDRLPRHRSIHVGGFVLSGEPLGNFVPIEPASMAGRTVIQWDKDDIGPMGMIKIDLLGLGMLTMIQEALKLVKMHRGIEIDLSQLDMKDPAIYDMLCAADTVGLFQVESRAQMSILPKLRPRCFYDIIVSIALVRPGPIQGNIVHPYMARRRGDEPVTYLHPTLEPILSRTLGVPLFQEQGMRLAVVAAGFSPSQADELRRVMSHKRSVEKMARLCEKLAEGMQKNGFSQEAVETITHQLKAFANYGFPESHAASFALLVYASAYLKKYFAPEFYCAMLNAQPMGFYSPATLVRDAMRHNVTVLSVDLAKSLWNCHLEPPDKAGGEPSLRIGLRYVRGLGNKAKESLEAAWHSGGPFISIEDVCRRSGLGWKALQILARAGAFESLHRGRRQALWQVLAQARKRQSMPLFEALMGNSPAIASTQLHELTDGVGADCIRPGAGNEPLRSEQEIRQLGTSLDKDRQSGAALPELIPLEEAVADYSTMGLSVGRHLMTFHREWALSRGIITCGEMAKRRNNESIAVAGGVICRQRPGTAKGFVFLTLEDETGMANVIIRPSLFQAYRHVILNSDFMSVTGTLQMDKGVANLIAEHVETLPMLFGKSSLPSRDFH